MEERRDGGEKRLRREERRDGGEQRWRRETSSGHVLTHTIIIFCFVQRGVRNGVRGEIKVISSEDILVEKLQVFHRNGLLKHPEIQRNDMGEDRCVLANWIWFGQLLNRIVCLS